jgi:hypothetical protein
VEEPGLDGEERHVDRLVPAAPSGDQGWRRRQGEGQPEEDGPNQGDNPSAHDSTEPSVEFSIFPASRLLWVRIFLCL